MKIVFAPEAQAEFSAAARWYAKEVGAKYATDFKNEIRRMLALLAQHPTLGSPIHDTSRRLVATRFPYNIVYRFDENTLCVIAIAHQRRLPGYWQARN